MQKKKRDIFVPKGIEIKRKKEKKERELISQERSKR